MKVSIFAVIGASMTLFAVSGIQAQTADDCIAEYENLKAEFELAAPGMAFNCVKNRSAIILDVEGPLPAGCTGSWDHWHMEAKATGQKEGACRMMLRGNEGPDGCGTEEFVMELPANEAAAWRNYLRGECEK